MNLVWKFYLSRDLNEMNMHKARLYFQPCNTFMLIYDIDKFVQELNAIDSLTQ